MPRRVDVTLSEEDREVLERWARQPKSAQAVALRCRIVLGAAEGEQSKEIAERLGCTTQTVGRWRGRFAHRGIDGLHDEPRPGQNQTAISRIWRAFGLRPHRSEHFKLSPDPQFVDKVRDIVGLYLTRRKPPWWSSVGSRS